MIDVGRDSPVSDASLIEAWPRNVEVAAFFF